ncbi:sulfotransferase 4A1-like isoform X2 [Acanthaster planci]|uniref:Sulfotransferase 4A1-like isoform X2 n=1 Tax=Acanthaster planci TaxID=133434 RepID=A0A8B7XEE8_ACAPL|nr:sulfotransferase 4A1-like isoform X2 [Acanthaster planci]
MFSVFSFLSILAPPGVWLQDLIYLLLEGGNLGKTNLSLETVEDSIPFLEAPSPGLELLKSLPSPRYIKSHLPYGLLPEGVRNKECKVIYITRNPKDVMCSFYDFHRTVRMVHYKGTFHQFFYRFINNKLGYGSYFRHVLEWWERRKDDNLLFLKYEDIRKDLKSSVEQLANFLERPLTPAALKEICTHFEEEVAYNRKEDRVGYWKYYFTVHMNEKFDKILPDRLSASTGLDFQYTL